MRLVLSLVGICFGLWPCAVFAITAAECREIRETYGVVSPKCVEVSGTSEDEGKTPKHDNPLTQQQHQDHIFFPSGGAAIDDVARERIATLADVLNSSVLSDACIQLVGHADSGGSEQANLDVALARATAVSQMISDLIAPSRVESVISQGEWQPLANIAVTDKWQRRVEIRVRRCS